MIDKSVNAGTDALTGFGTQRNAALYLLFSDYHTKFKGQKYFVCLEHHDDFLFCFLDDKDNAKLIEAYQSKKKSPATWTLTKNMYTVISKLLDTGTKLVKDSIPKAKDYKHYLHFSSNQTIYLEDKKSKTSVSIKEDNLLVGFNDLDDKLKKLIQKNIYDSSLHDELTNLHFLFFDLNRTASKQEDMLVGLLGTVFSNSISNHRAALKALFILFEKIEKTFNQGNKAKLLDKTKRVTSTEIENALRIITTQSKAFDYWRNEEETISVAMEIKPFERDNFKLKFESAFDLFKSIEEAEHRKILSFVKENIVNCRTYTVKENVFELYSAFINRNTTPFPELDLKAILYAAYFEATLKKN